MTAVGDFEEELRRAARAEGIALEDWEVDATQAYVPSLEEALRLIAELVGSAGE